MKMAFPVSITCVVFANMSAFVSVASSMTTNRKQSPSDELASVENHESDQSVQNDDVSPIPHAIETALKSSEHDSELKKEGHHADPNLKDADLSYMETLFAVDEFGDVDTHVSKIRCNSQVARHHL